MRPSRGTVRYHVPRERSPVPAVLVGALVVVTLVSAQLSIAGEPRRDAPGGTAAASAEELAPDAPTSETSTDAATGDPTATAPDDTTATDPPTATAGTTATDDPTPTEEPTAPDSPSDAPTDDGTDAGTGLPRPVELTFAVGEDDPSGDADALLAPVVEALLADPTTRVQVVGHASPSNDPVLEEQLSLRRAETALALLVDRGIPASRADVVGAGAEEAGGSLSGTDRRVVVEVVED